MSDEASRRHATAAQHLQRQLIEALTQNRIPTEQEVTNWLRGVRIERESQSPGLGFDSLPPDDDELADYTDDQLADLSGRIDAEKRRRRTR
jgi:hypothetical protein